MRSMPLLRPDLSPIPTCQRLPESGNGLPLHINEAPNDWPQIAGEAQMARLNKMPFSHHPELQEELTERLRKRLGAPEGGLLLGPSSSALLDLVALAGISAGEQVAIPEPGPSLYPRLVRRHGGEVHPVPMGKDFPLEPWFGALGCRQIWLNIHNNPTGAWVSPTNLKPLLEAAAARPAPPLVVLDEADAEFAPATHRLAVDQYPNLILLRTFSNAVGSAPWRLGYLLGNPALVSRLASLQMPDSIPAASLEALAVALEYDGLFEPPSPRKVRRLLALDIDGVLIDADRSFMEAVRRALAELRPALPWSDETFRTFKRLGGFNNDFRLTAGALALAEIHGDGDLIPILETTTAPMFDDYLFHIQELEKIVQPIVQRHYRDTLALEQPLVTLPELEATGWDLAVLTGRPPEELALAWQVLGFTLPAVCDAGPHLRKPAPGGLLQLADAFRAEEILFVGDTVDDGACLRAAAALRPELTWRFAALGPDRRRFAAPEDHQFATLRELLPMLNQETTG